MKDYELEVGKIYTITSGSCELLPAALTETGWNDPGGETYLLKEGEALLIVAEDFGDPDWVVALYGDKLVFAPIHDRWDRERSEYEELVGE